MLKKGVSHRQGYGRQASSVLGPLLYSPVRSGRQAYSAEVATKAGSTCGLAKRTPRLREGMLFEHSLLPLVVDNNDEAQVNGMRKIFQFINRLL